MPSSPPQAVPVDQQVLTLCDQGGAAEALRLGLTALQGLDGAARGRLLIALTKVGTTLGDFRAALAHAVEACDLFPANGDAPNRVDAVVALAGVLMAAGDHTAALEALEEGETLLREPGDPPRRSRLLRLMGSCASVLGRHQHALSCLHEALVLAGPEQRLVRLSLYNAENRHAASLPPGSDQALQALLPYIELWQELADDFAAAGNARLEAMALGNRAITLHNCGRTAEAVAALQGLLGRYAALGMQPNVAITHNELGHCFEALQQPLQAREHFLGAQRLLSHGGSVAELRRGLEGLSRSEEALGHLADALSALREVRRLDARMSDETARAAVVRRELRIELARLTSQWAQQAQQDPLTGLGNRRALERWLAEHGPRVERGEPLSLVLMDLDHFKQINDRHGHDTGDEVLRRVAELIRRHCRGGDLAARYGGEEFLLALAGAPPSEAVLVAERVRESVAAHGWPAVRPGLAVTVSIGVTHAAEAGDAPGLLTLADQRLYRAKIEGRNRVVHA